MHHALLLLLDILVTLQSGRESSLQVAPVLEVPSIASLKGFLASFGRLLPQGHQLLVTASPVPSALACRDPLCGKAGEFLYMG